MFQDPKKIAEALLKSGQSRFEEAQEIADAQKKEEQHG